MITVWGIPDLLMCWAWRLPRQCEHWLAMTYLLHCAQCRRACGRAMLAPTVGNLSDIIFLYQFAGLGIESVFLTVQTLTDAEI